MDGVAGVTQDEVPIGSEFTYRFVANQVGTYWYHSHQVSHEQVIGGLFGTLVVLPKTGGSEAVDVIATAHTYAGTKTINGVAGDLQVPGQTGRAGTGPGDQYRQWPDRDLGRHAFPGAGNRRLPDQRPDRCDRSFGDGYCRWPC